MARPMKKKPSKGVNGVGVLVVVNFDENDPAERRALQAAQLLASKHGRRKQAILALFEAVFARYEATGEVMTPLQIAVALSTIQPAAQRPAMGFTPAIGRQIAPPAMPDRGTSDTKFESLITVEQVSNKVSAQEFANNFLGSMAGFLD